jgi:ornithine cyclodeaminase
MRFFNAEDVRRLLPMEACIEAMAAALAALAQGRAMQPLRSIMRLPEGGGLLGMMPAFAGDLDRIGIKVITVFPHNHGTPYDSHQGAVLLFEGRHGSPLCAVDASEVTAIRTAAVSGLATRLLAREDAGEVAILGCGVQGRTHLEAMRAVRPLRRVRLWSRTADSAHRLAKSGKSAGLDVVVAASAHDAVDGASVVCTTTASSEPILEGTWLAPGCHVNAVGACFPTARELDAAAVARSSLFVDRRESALAEAGDLLLAIGEGAVRAEHIRAELGDVLLGTHPGRTSPDEITLFESLGIGVEDVAAAELVYRNGTRSDDDDATAG